MVMPLCSKAENPLDCWILASSFEAENKKRTEVECDRVASLVSVSAVPLPIFPSFKQHSIKRFSENRLGVSTLDNKDAHSKFGQPLETILYEKNGKFNFALFGDVYPGFTMIYGGLDKTIYMINITSAQISVWGCHYGMSGAEIKSALGTAGLVPSMGFREGKDFSYHFENKTNPIRITFFDDALTSIKNIQLAATK